MRMHGQSSQRGQRGAGAENAAGSFRRTLPLVAGVLEKAVQREGCVLCHALRDIEKRALFSSTITVFEMSHLAPKSRECGVPWNSC